MSQGSQIKFGFRVRPKQSSAAHAAPTALPPGKSAGVNCFLDEPTFFPDDPDEIKSRSLVTSFSAKGGFQHVEGSLTRAETVKCIPCPVPLDPPRQSSSGKHIEINPVINSKSPDSPPSSYGLKVRKDVVAGDVDELGPPTSVPPRERDLSAFAKHKGVCTARRLQNQDDTAKDHPICYESMPVSEFGLALVRGMGYDPAKDHTEPVLMKKRVYVNAGLGADRAFELLAASAVTSKSAVQPN